MAVNAKTKIMNLNAIQEEKIISALINYRKDQFDGTDQQFCKIFEINPSVFSELKKGKRDRLIRSDKLVSIGRKLGVHFKDDEPWNIVQTNTFQYITAQLKYCQDKGEARILVDIAGIGKSTAAKQYMMGGKNVYYLDCSSHKTRSLFLKALARAVGVNSHGSVQSMFEDIIFMLQATNKPIVILDEAGDLSYEAFLEIKAIWNRLEGYCGWYMMGADGLKAKIENNLRSKKVGYAEIFDRFGKDFKSASPANPVEQKIYLRQEAEAVVHANIADKSKVKEVLNKTISLRRVKSEIQKLNDQHKKKQAA